VPLRFRWSPSCESLPDEVRRAAESHLSRLWVLVSEMQTGHGTTADFRLSLDDWTVRYAIDLGSHTVLLRDATADKIEGLALPRGPGAGAAPVPYLERQEVSSGEATKRQPVRAASG
jgi:hypothetical protein